MPVLQALRLDPDEFVQLRPALALLPDEATQKDFLTSRMLRGRLDEVDELLVIRQALQAQGHGQGLVPQLWLELDPLPRPFSDRQLNAAAALALFDPGDRRWADLGELVAARLLRVHPLLTQSWYRSFRPVGRSLFGTLKATYTDLKEPEDRRARWPSPCS